MLGAGPIPDAGDAQDEHLGVGDGKGIIDRPATQRAEWPRRREVAVTDLEREEVVREIQSARNCAKNGHNEIADQRFDDLASVGVRPVTATTVVLVNMTSF